MENIIITAFQQMLLFLPLAFGMYLTYCVMSTTDLTVEATFVLGAAIFARLVTVYDHTTFAVIAAIALPSLAGLAVAMMRKFARIDSLIASVLAIYMLYTINFTVMGRPNINLLNTSLVLLNDQHTHPVLVWGGITLGMLLLGALLVAILHGRFGLLLRAIGINESLAKMLGEPCFLLTIIGLMLSNSLSALSGILTAQIDGYADIGMGTGMALTAIGAMMIGMTVFRRHLAQHFNAAYDLLACAFGVMVYFVVLNGLLYFDVNPIYLKLLMGLMLVFFLSGAVRGHKKGVAHG
jgi:putative ABC transport system permease protein